MPIPRCYWNTAWLTMNTPLFRNHPWFFTVTRCRIFFCHMSFGVRVFWPAPLWHSWILFGPRRRAVAVGMHGALQPLLYSNGAFWSGCISVTNKGFLVQLVDTILDSLGGADKAKTSHLFLAGDVCLCRCRLWHQLLRTVLRHYDAVLGADNCCGDSQSGFGHCPTNDAANWLAGTFVCYRGCHFSNPTGYALAGPNAGTLCRNENGQVESIPGIAIGGKTCR